MNKLLSKNTITQLLITAAGLVLFLSWNSGVHLFDWDEINFAESAREMIVTGNYSTVQINFQPFWEKPPLFIWMQVLSMKIFGINEFAARFPNAICGVATLLFLFNAGRKLIDYNFALLWTIVYACSFLPFFYFKTGIIDPWFNLFIFSSIWLLIRYTDPDFKGNRMLTAIIAGFLIGLATLTKGPVAVLLLGLSLCAFIVIRKFKVKFAVGDILMFVFSALVSGGGWFAWQWVAGNGHIISDFIQYQIRLFSTRDAGHGGFLLYHFVVLFMGVFPASVFMVAALRKNKSTINTLNHFNLWNLILLSVILVLFTIVKTKIVHYSSLAYFPISYLAAVYLHKKIQNREKLPAWASVTTIFFALLFLTITLSLSFFDDYKHLIINSNLVNDKFTIANMQANGAWHHTEWLPGLFLLAGSIVFTILNRQQKIKKAVMVLFGSSLFFIYGSSIMIVPHIERYSQLPLIEFCQSKSNTGAYVNSIGFKSYAILFYANRQPPGIPNVAEFEPVKAAAEGRDVYFIMKINHREKYSQQFPNLVFLDEKNGFVLARYP